MHLTNSHGWPSAKVWSKYGRLSVGGRRRGGERLVVVCTYGFVEGRAKKPKPPNRHANHAHQHTHDSADQFHYGPFIGRQVGSIGLRSGTRQETPGPGLLAELQQAFPPRVHLAAGGARQARKGWRQTTRRRRMMMQVVCWWNFGVDEEKSGMVAVGMPHYHPSKVCVRASNERQGRA